jgi:hypothetical protein
MRYLRRFLEWLLADTEPSDLSDDHECAGMGCSRFTPCSWECERAFSGVDDDG